jgi:hypothetical protein
MAEKDPLSQCYDLLSQLAFNNKTIKSLVKPANLIVFTSPVGSKNVVLPKSEIGEGDLPEMRITPTGGTPKIGCDSDHTAFLQKFDFQIASGTLDAEATMFPLTFAMLCAWTSWHPLFGELVWHEQPFVHKATAGEATQGIAILDANRGIRGWATVWSVQVDIWLPTAELKTLNTI